MSESFKKISRLIVIICNLIIAIGFIYSSFEDGEMIRVAFWCILLICDIYTISELVEAYDRYKKLEYMNKQLLKKIGDKHDS